MVIVEFSLFFKNCNFSVVNFDLPRINLALPLLDLGTTLNFALFYELKKLLLQTRLKRVRIQQLTDLLFGLILLVTQIF